MSFERVHVKVQGDGKSENGDDFLEQYSTVLKFIKKYLALI